MDNKMPKVGQFVRKSGKLIKIEEFPPIEPPKDYIFEDTEAVCEIWLKGEKLSDLGTYNNYYGEGTAVKTAIKEMTAYCKARNITTDSDIEVVITKVTSQCRKRPITITKYNDEKCIDFQSLDYGCKRDLPDDTEEVVWSSKNVW